MLTSQTSLNNSQDQSLTSTKKKKKRTLEDFEYIKEVKNGVSKDIIGLLKKQGQEKSQQSKRYNKLSSIYKISKQILNEHASVSHLRREIKLQKKLDHPHIIKLFYEFEDTDHVYLVLEYADMGSLFFYLRKKKKFTEEEAFVYFLQTAIGIDYLHKMNVIHRDLKPENLLMDKQGNIKICDFGWSAESLGQRSTFCGTLDYMSPEMLSNQPHDYKVDTWSIGVLLYEMLHGNAPFSTYNARDRITQAILSCEVTGITFQPQISNEARDLITKILRVDPKNRLSFVDIFQHPWLKKYEKIQNMNIKDFIYKYEEPPIQNERANKFVEDKTKPNFNSLYDNSGLVPPSQTTTSNTNRSKSPVFLTDDMQKQKDLLFAKPPQLSKSPDLSANRGKSQEKIFSEYKKSPADIKNSIVDMSSSQVSQIVDQDRGRSKEKIFPDFKKSTADIKNSIMDMSYSQTLQQSKVSQITDLDRGRSKEKIFDTYRQPSKSPGLTGTTEVKAKPKIFETDEFLNKFQNRSVSPNINMTTSQVIQQKYSIRPGEMSKSQNMQPAVYDNTKQENYNAQAEIEQQKQLLDSHKLKEQNNTKQNDQVSQKQELERKRQLQYEQIQEKQRLETQRQEQIRQDQYKEDQQKQEQTKLQEQERIESQRLETLKQQQRKQEQQKLDRQKEESFNQEQQRQAQNLKNQEERQEQQRQEQQRLDQQRQEQQRLDQQRQEQYKLEQQRQEQQRQEQQKQDQQKQDQQRQDQQRQDQQRKEQLNQELYRQDQQRQDQQRQDQLNQEQIRLDNQKQEQQRYEQQRQEQQRQEQSRQDQYNKEQQRLNEIEQRRIQTEQSERELQKKQEIDFQQKENQQQLRINEQMKMEQMRNEQLQRQRDQQKQNDIEEQLYKEQQQQNYRQRQQVLIPDDDRVQFSLEQSNASIANVNTSKIQNQKEKALADKLDMILGLNFNLEQSTKSDKSQENSFQVKKQEPEWDLSYVQKSSQQINDQQQPKTNNQRQQFEPIQEELEITTKNVPKFKQPVSPGNEKQTRFTNNRGTSRPTNLEDRNTYIGDIIDDCLDDLDLQDNPQMQMFNQFNKQPKPTKEKKPAARNRMQSTPSNNQVEQNKQLKPANSKFSFGDQKQQEDPDYYRQTKNSPQPIQQVKRNQSSNLHKSQQLTRPEQKNNNKSVNQSKQIYEATDEEQADLEYSKRSRSQDIDDEQYQKNQYDEIVQSYSKYDNEAKQIRQTKKKQIQKQDSLQESKSKVERFHNNKPYPQAPKLNNQNTSLRQNQSLDQADAFGLSFADKKFVKFHNSFNQEEDDYRIGPRKSRISERNQLTRRKNEILKNDQDQDQQMDFIDRLKFAFGCLSRNQYQAKQ